MICTSPLAFFSFNDPESVNYLVVYFSVVLTAQFAIKCLPYTEVVEGEGSRAVNDR
jgi:hypothetical protein